MARKKKPKLTEGDILDLISQRSEYSWGYFLTQVGLEGRIADGVWLNPSHLRLIGFEVKCARGDWIKELRDPWKWYTVGKFCDQWYLVISTRDIIKPGELPKEWGLMVCEGVSTKILKRAPKNEKPERWNRELVATLLKKLRPPHEPDELTRARKEGWEEGYQEGLERRKLRRSESKDDAEEELRELRAKMTRFEEITGVSISGWNMERVAQDLKIVREMTRGGLRSQGARFADHCEATAKTIRDSLQIIEEDDEETLVVPVGDDGMPGNLREIARALIRYDSTLRRAATTIDGLSALVDCPLPTIEDPLLHKAAKAVEPIVGLLGPMLTIGLTRRIAKVLQEIEHAEGTDARGGGGSHRKLLSG